MPDGRFTEEFFNEPIGNHIRTDFSTVRPDWTIEDALEYLRANPPPGRVIYFYVTRDDGTLQGVVPTRRLLLNPPSTPIRDIMVPQVVAVPHDATVLETCEFFSMHKLLALPVVDDDRKLIGVVDVDLYTEELVETTGDVRDDVFQIIGVHLNQLGRQQPVEAAKGRFPWLLCNVAGGLLAAWLSGLFDDVLTWRHAVLALFVPIVLALAESVTIQSVTLVLQSMRASRGTFAQLLRRILREAATGLLLGLGTSVIVASVALLWRQDLRVATILFIGILSSVTVAAMIGVAVPSLLRLLKRDPQVAAGPICLAMTDAATLIIYFGYARWIGLN